jgi:hypothetical protein
LQGDSPARKSEADLSSSAAAVLDVHGAPTNMQESGEK